MNRWSNESGVGELEADEQALWRWTDGWKGIREGRKKGRRNASRSVAYYLLLVQSFIFFLGAGSPQLGGGAQVK